MGIGRSHDRPKRSSPNFLLPLVFNSALKFGIMTNEEFIESIRLDGEIWKDVVGYEGYYIVSNYGRIASIRMVCEYLDNGVRKSRKMTQHLCSTSVAPSARYRRMTLVRDTISETQLVHRIVAMAFVDNPNNHPVVDHIDNNPLNNNSDNLRWCTQRDNLNKDHRRNAYRATRSLMPAHNRKPVVRVSDSGEVKIYESSHHTNVDGFHQSAVIRVCMGQQGKHKGYSWMYLSDYNKKKKE